MQNGKLEIYEK